MLRYKTVCLIYVTLAGLNAFFFLFFPFFSLNAMQTTTNDIGIFAMQMAGGCALGLAVIVWLSRNSKDPSLQRIVLLGNLITMLALTYADIFALRCRAFNWIGWTFLIADFGMSILFLLLLLRIRR